MKCKMIALTGNIGSGKSQVGSYLKQKGYQVADCDEICHRIATAPEFVESVANLLGSNYVANGVIDSAKIRAELFDQPQLLAQYGNLFYGRLAEIINELADNCGTLFVEIPLFDAVKIDWHAVWMVKSSLDVRKRRVAIRDDVDEISVEKIDKLQKEFNRPTAVIQNDGSIENLYRQVDALLQTL